MKRVWEWYKGFTTLGGLTQIIASRNGLPKTFWTILTISGLVLTFISLFQTLFDIFSYPVTTSVTLKTLPYLAFPTVTLCNSNRIHCGQLLTKIQNCQKNATCKSQRLENLCGLYELTGCEISIKYAEKMKTGTVPNTDEICSELDPKLKEEIKRFHNYFGLRRDHAVTTMFYQMYLNLTIEEMQEIAHQPDQMITYCSFANNNDYKECQDFTNKTTVATVRSPRYFCTV